MCASFCINFYYIPEIILKYDGKAAVNNKILNVVYSQKHEEIMVLMSRENTFKQNLCISGITKLRNLNMYGQTFIKSSSHNVLQNKISVKSIICAMCKSISRFFYSESWICVLFYCDAFDNQTGVCRLHILTWITVQVILKNCLVFAYAILGSFQNASDMTV